MTTSEQQIELDLIAKLGELKYIYRPDIHDRAALETNFRSKFEALNHVHLTDSEFQRLLDNIITPDVYHAAQLLRHINSFERDDGTPLNYTLVNIHDWCKNDFEVVNQLRMNTNNSHHRYDVMLLINGLPVVQIELKTLAVSPRRAMQQIVDYKHDPGNGYGKTLLCFVQLFIVSNRTDTWYFANNNARHFSFNADERFLPVYQWASEDNQKITQLDRFAEKFLAKCTLGQMISRYMVLVASEQKLMMMRPYQIYAVKAIVECIQQNCGNGYIWHTTGSGKTLTSFKASTLLKDNPNIAKCLFVVDRKDLDRQTREEFNRFQEGCVEENTHTETLVRRLLSEDYADKVIVTTIQKLGLALDGTNKRNYKERLEPLRHQRMVFIFDECHRSQFGDNHRAIKAFFPNAQLFGFTGTPIFEQNASYQQIEGQQASYRTTDDLFQRCLHQYTITHAIEDRNVLRFHVDYYKVAGASSSRNVVGASCSRRELEAPATFVWEYLNPYTEISISTSGNLPHWAQGSVWYFVTFRLADALPKAVIEEIKTQRERWKQTHDLETLSREQIVEYHKLFSQRYEALLNAGSGSCVLANPENAKIVETALRYFEGQRYELDEFIVMPNHVHVLVKPFPGYRLTDILHSWKSFTAKQINQRISKTGQLWQHESYDHIVRNEKAMEAIRRYIRENPIVAGASCSCNKTRELEAPATLPKPGEGVAKAKVIETILAKHDAATHGRKFNAILATASINDAIEYCELFASVQKQQATQTPEFRPLNIACVFSPPAEGNKDVLQIQEDLPQEKLDNQQDPIGKQAALTCIIADYNTRFGTSHRLSEFDLYYQDVQKRIKDQQYPNSDLPATQKIDITIVVDMLLTGFDSKYLNTLYVDKNLKHHGLIQAFSRTNRVLNDSKPYGNILDFRQQQKSVEEAIALFSGEKIDNPRQIWLVEPATKVLKKYAIAVAGMADFMTQKNLLYQPAAVYNLKGDAARIEFISRFKEVQRLKTQLDQYTDLEPGQKANMEAILPQDQLLSFRSTYLETAKQLKAIQDEGGDQVPPEVQQLDFEFVLFASAVIDYDYIMGLIAKLTQQKPGKITLNREQLISLIQSDAKFIDEREDIAEYIRGLPLNQALDEQQIRSGYERFKAGKKARELTDLARRHGLAPDAVQVFVDDILRRRIFDGERLSELMASLDLGWKARIQKETELMAELAPLLRKLAQGREISGLDAYEH